MNLSQEMKKKWVTALRSGDYPQGRLMLRPTNGYCCLAVLQEVSGKSFTAFNLHEHCAKLINMNDGTQGEREHSFEEIADYIEAKL